MRRASFLFVALLLPVVAFSQSPPASDADPLASIGDLPKLADTRDEAAQDKIHGTALLAHARILQQRRDFPAALRRYQRAYRYDDAGRGLKEIVSLALEAGRTDVAARYAALGGRRIEDLIVLRRLAVDATNRQDWKTAAKLYEASLATWGSPAAKSATQVLMRAELGRLHFLGDDFERAAQCFAEVREALAKAEEYELSESIQKVIVGDRRQTYSLMARAALEAKQYDDALALFRETYRDLPDSDEAQLDEASVLLRRGETAEALVHVSKVLEKGGRESSAAFFLLRQILSKTLAEKQLEAALEERLAPVQAAHPENESLRRHLAECQLAQDKLNETSSLLLDPAINKPSDELRLLLAQVQRRRKHAEQWLQTLATLVTSSSISVIEDEARQAAANNEFAGLALEVAKSAKSESVQEKAVQGIAAVVALEQKQYDEAERLWQNSLPDDAAAKGRLLTLWGLRLMQVDQYERAITALQRVIDEKLVESDPGPVWYYLAGAATFAKKHDLAISAAANAQQARPNDTRFLIREAWVLQRAGKREGARHKYEDLLRRFDKLSDAKVRSELLQVRRALSSLCHELGDEAAAVERLEEVLDEFPDDPGALNDLSYLWADRGSHLQRSLRMVKRAVDLDPDNNSFRDSLGWIYFRLGRYEESVGELEKAAAGESPGGVILDHLGDALAKAGRAGDAQSAWQRAAESFRKDGDEGNASRIEKKIQGE